MASLTRRDAFRCEYGRCRDLCRHEHRYGAGAKRRVRIERIKVEAEFDDARVALERQRAAAGGATAAQVTLTEEQVWALATRWFVEQERAGVSRPVEIGDEEIIQNLSEDLAWTCPGICGET